MIAYHQSYYIFAACDSNRSTPLTDLRKSGYEAVL